MHNMKSIIKTIIIIVFTLNLLLTQCESKTHSTSLSYVYSYETKPNQNIAQVILQVTNKNYQLSSSYQQTESIISAIKSHTQNYCQHYKLKQKPCNTTLETIDQETQTFYKVTNNNKNMVFSNFLHKETLRIKVINARNVANLMDQILKISKDISMVSFDWKPQNDDKLYEFAMKAGVEEGFRLCEQINGQLEKVVRVEEIVDFQVQQFTEQDVQQTQQEEQLLDQEKSDIQQSEEHFEEEKPAIKWKFQVLCKIN